MWQVGTNLNKASAAHENKLKAAAAATPED